MKKNLRIAAHTIKVLEFRELMATVAEYAATEGGKRYLNELVPETDFASVKTRLAETKEFCDLFDAGNEPHLSAIPALEQWFSDLSARRVPFEPNELNDIAAALEAVYNLKIQMKERAQYLPLMKAYGEKLFDFSKETARIREVIGPDDKVRDSASKELKEIRKQIEKTENLIRDRLQYLLNSPALKDALENRNLLERDGRPVIALKASCRRAIPGVLHDRSQTGQTVFIEPQAIAGLANELEEKRYEERREITRILWSLTGNLADIQLSAMVTAKAVTYIDAVLAKARFGRAYGALVPDLSEDGSLVVTGARHPLLMKYEARKAHTKPENVSSKLTPLDFRLGEEFNLVVVTGPNTGGKTVVLKTLGLLSLMAQSGLPVPAVHPLRLPVYKKIFADIGDEQSIEQSLSTFSSHLTNMAEILSEADEESLVLLDEVGSGTDPAEGAALGVATLDYLKEKGAKTVITTHLGALKAYAYQAVEVENASMEFDKATLLPTYRLLLGQPGSSNALAIARRYQLPKSLTDRMEEILTEENQNGAAELINRVQHVKTAAEKARRRNERLRLKLTQSLRDASKEKEDAIERAEAQIAYVMQDVLGEVLDFSKNAENAPEPWKSLSFKLKERLEKIAAGTPREQYRLEFLANLKENETVYVSRFRAFGEVKKISRRQKSARVLLDGVLYDLPFDALEEKPFTLPDRRVAKAPISPKKEFVPPKPEVLLPVRKRDAKTAGSFLKKLKEGDLVFVPQLQEKGQILRIDKTRTKAKVKLGAIEVQVPLETLEKPE